MINTVTLGKDGFYHDAEKRPYVRVSTVLKEFGFIDGQHFDEDSRLRGTAVHKAIEFRFKGTLNEKTLDPQLRGWVDAVDSFMAENKFVPKYLEAAVLSPLYRFAGRLDAFGDMNGEPAIIDIKSGSAGKATDLQTAAYAHCMARLLGVSKVRRYALELRPTGSYRLKPFANDNSEGVFLGLAAAYWYKWNLGVVKKDRLHR